MKNRFFTVILLFIFLISMAGNAIATTPVSPDLKALVYVELDSPEAIARFATTQLPLYTRLDGGLLTGADQAGQQALQQAGLSFQVVDPDLRSGSYYFAETFPGRSAINYTIYGQILLTTENGTLLRMSPSQVDALAQAGAELRLITLTPKPLPSEQSTDIFPDVVDPDPLIQLMIDQVTTEQVSQYDRELAGELPVWVDDDWYTITSRYTYSGTPIEKTMHYVGQHMEGLEMNVEYHEWGGPTYPNVIGEIPGLTNPEDIFIIGAHIDDVQGTPGADDNASGSVATLIAADILSQSNWGCTLRFAFWTGEEQGLNGSAAYAQRAFNNGENILGYLNLDMIAWNTIGSQPGIDLYYSTSVPGTLEFAQLFADVVPAYNLNLVPQLGTGVTGSDHASFWQYGFNSILGIEDNGDFNPYYHGSGDTPAHTDLPYFTDFVKASIATFVHKNGCLIPSGLGSLDGHVTAEIGGSPIENAAVVIEDEQGRTFSVTTDVSGYYTRTLLAGIYDVTSSAYGYLPSTVTGVEVTSDTVTTLDFSLMTAPTYVISGTVTENGTGVPLYAEIDFVGSPVMVWSDPSTGFYQAELPQGNYTLQVRSDLHNPQERAIVVDHDQTQNFTLDPLPCILLVDDDNDAPDTTPYYTAALNNLGYDYNIFNAGGGDSPGLNDLLGYRMILWYSGDAFGGSAGPNSTEEGNLSQYLDSGGSLFLDSQDYLYDFGLTPFGQNYLGISSYVNDSGNSLTKYGVMGDPIGNGLGPFSLTYPSGFSDYGDIVYAGGGASVAFRSSPSGGNNLDLDKDGGEWKTVFFGTSWVPIYNNNPANGEAVLERMVDWFGGCQGGNGGLEGHITDAVTGDPLEGVSVVAVPGGFNDLTDPSGLYTITLPADTYTVTATLDGYDPLSQNVSISAGQVSTLDFTLQPVCEPVSGLDFSWQPAEPYIGDLITFTAEATGTEPIDFQWNFGDTYTDTGIVVSHTYTEAMSYTVGLSATNACGSDQVSKPISIWQYIWDIFLPLLGKN